MAEINEVALGTNELGVNPEIANPIGEPAVKIEGPNPKVEVLKLGFATGAASMAGGLMVYGIVTAAIRLVGFVKNKIQAKRASASKGEKPCAVGQETTKVDG